MTGELWKLPLEKLAPAIRTGKISPVALTEACLDRIAGAGARIGPFACARSLQRPRR